MAHTHKQTDGHGNSMTNSAQWGQIGENPSVNILGLIGDTSMVVLPALRPAGACLYRKKGHTENYNLTKYSSPICPRLVDVIFVLQFMARQTKRALFTTRKCLKILMAFWKFHYFCALFHWKISNV